MATRRVIALLGQPYVTEEGKAIEAIVPGMLVQGVTTHKRNATASAVVPKAFALERDEMGDGINVPYASGDTVKIGHFWPGQRVYALLASGQTVAEDGKLEAAIDGYVKAGTTAPIGRAIEAVNNTTGGVPRVRMEIL
jgi:hypothetical protein